MSERTERRPGPGDSALKPHYAAAAIALVVVIVIGVLSEIRNRHIDRQSLRADVRNQINVIKARLEGNINGNIQLVRGLVNSIATEPRMDQERFTRLARNLIDRHSQLRNVAAAPNLVISMIYPIEGNEKAIGLDYRKNAAQRDAALRARARRELVLAGPVDLVQGGRGIIGRFPVFINQPEGGEEFWGLVAAVIDADMLYQASGLRDPALDIMVALRGRDGTGATGAPFYGDAGIHGDEPVTADVRLPIGSWEIAAVPKDGWNQVSEDAWLVRLVILIAGALIVVPIAIAGRLFEERQRNLRKLRQGEAQLARLSKRHQLALEASRIGVWEYEIDADRLHWDDRVIELYGLEPGHGPARPRDWRRMVHPDDRNEATAELVAAIDTNGGYKSEYRILTPTGHVRWLRDMGSVQASPDGTRSIIGVSWDVTADIGMRETLKRAMRNAEVRNVELEEARAQMEYNSLHDALTGLPNRRYLDQVLKQDAAGGHVALLHIDLDRFKHINDTMGHAAGDAMLVHAAAVLKENLRAGDFVARVGGDEFVLVSRSATENDQLAALASRIIEQMRQPVPYDGHECRFGVSVGVANAMSRPIDPKRLLINADVALYRAKNRGRNRFEFFTEAHQAEIARTKRIADQILSGLERDEFLPYFQPQFDARTLDIIGIEALARWQHPTEGLLTPEFFLKTADELNVAGMIDRVILEKALWQKVRWAAAGISVAKLSVNVSAGRLGDDKLIESLEGLVIEPRSLTFELLESIFLDESDDVFASNIRQLKRMGIGIEIDDFGTGYASIVSLLKLQPQRLKIDQQLVMPIVKSIRQRQLVSSIVEIGRSLGVEVIAEGVETRRHARILAELGCNAVQGYAFARPMSGADFIAFVGAQRWRKAS